jgi:hypothetical protein
MSKNFEKDVITELKSCYNLLLRFILSEMNLLFVSDSHKRLKLTLVRRLRYSSSVSLKNLSQLSSKSRALFA